MTTLRTERYLTTMLVVAVLLGFTGSLSAPSAAASSDVAVVVRGASVDAAADAVRSIGGTVGNELSYIGGVSAQLSEDALATLQRDPTVQVVLDEPMEFSSADLEKATAPAGAATTTDLQLAAMNLGETWSNETGTGVGVALIDTGVVETPELAGRVVHGPDYSDEGDGVDRYGHGTFMAGLIAADSSTTTGAHDGVAPGAHIVSLKLAGRDGVTSLSKVLDAIGWVVVNQDQYGIRVLNLSVGVPTNRAPQADPLSAAVQAAWASGLTVVAASGNEGNGTVTSPGRDPWVITVGATDVNGTAAVDDDTMPSWSGSGKVTNFHKAELLAPGAGVVSLRAPGSNIDESFPDARVGDGFFRGSGTSMSTALTSGAAAALLEFRPFATPDDVKGALVSTGVDIQGAQARAVDLAAADAADADRAWNQDHHVVFTSPDKKLKKGMPWSQGSSPDTQETWARMLWAEGGWQRMLWADAEFARMLWAGEVWQRMLWADAEFTRMLWAGTSWSDANEARASWADASSTRTAWSRMLWAGTSWSGQNSPDDGSWVQVGWQAASWAGSSSR